MAEDFVDSGLTIQETELLVSDATGLDTSVAVELTRIDAAITAVGRAICTWETGPWWWQRELATFQTNAPTIETIANDGATRSSNVSTMTTTAAHGIEANQLVNVSGVSDSTFNGNWVVSSVTSTTILYSQVGDDVAVATAGTGTVTVLSYPLRSIDIAGKITSTDGDKIAWRTWAIDRVYFDNDWVLRPVRWTNFQTRLRILEPTGAGNPFLYTLQGDPPQLYLWPPPSDGLNVFIDLVRRHSSITKAGSNDAALIVPNEFQWIYVTGATWLLKHETADPASLKDSPAFVEWIDRMASADPSRYNVDQQENQFPDSQPGQFPHDRRVIVGPDGHVLIQNTVSL